MTAETVAVRPHSRRLKPSVSAGKSATAARLARIHTDGLGAQDDDFAFFLGLDPIEQSRLIRDGMEAVIVSRIATELLDIPAILRSTDASVTRPVPAARTAEVAN